jgi:hypothetical protein
MAQSPLYGANSRRFDYRDRLASQLMGQGADTSPIQSPWQGLARLAQGAVGGYLADKSEQDRTSREKQYTDALASALMGGGDATAIAQRLAANPATAQLAPQFQMQGMQQTAQQQAEERRAQAEGQRFDRDLAVRREDTAAQREFQANQARENLAFRAQDTAAQRDQARMLAEMQRRTALEAAQLRAGNRADPVVPVRDPNDPNRTILMPSSQAAGMEAPRPAQRAENLPSAALKLQNEAVEQIGLVSSINSDLGRFGQMMDEGKLTFGPVENLMNRARNLSGRSTEQSANFASFQSSLEKLRNDSLRLNSGVQTEGDAQRAWNELFQNINDPRIVRQRLAEIQRINERAAALKQTQIDLTRANFGLPPLDTSQFRNVAPAVGGGEQPKQQQETGPNIDALLQKYGQ